jgi:hypothetical protein
VISWGQEKRHLELQSASLISAPLDSSSVAKPPSITAHPPFSLSNSSTTLRFFSAVRSISPTVRFLFPFPSLSFLTAPQLPGLFYSSCSAACFITPVYSAKLHPRSYECQCGPGLFSAMYLSLSVGQIESRVSRCTRTGVISIVEIRNWDTSEDGLKRQGPTTRHLNLVQMAYLIRRGFSPRGAETVHTPNPCQ